MLNEKTFLIVDDDDINRRVMKLTLNKLGFYHLTFADSGFLAEKHIREKGNFFDVIFMDCSMPYQNGYITSRNIRKLGFTKTIIAVTATHTDIRTCKTYGMDDLIYKPYNKLIIVEKLSYWLA